MSEYLIYISAFLGVAALVGGGALLIGGTTDREVEDRLSAVTTAPSNRKGGGKKGDSAKEGSVLARPWEGGETRIVEYFARIGNLRLLLEQADTSLTPTLFLGISAGLAVAGGMIPAVFRLNPALWLATAAALGLLPLAWLIARRNRRFKVFAKQLPEALELIARALRAGHSLVSGISLVSDEMSDPIRKEFSRLFEEQNLGIPLDQALESLTLRVPNLDLRFFATAVILQRQTGGDLAEILDKIGYIVRERFKIWGQVQALTGEGRISGVVLLALPPGLLAAVYYLNPGYITPLFTDPLGQKMLAGAVVMQLLGALVIRKIINIKV